MGIFEKAGKKIDAFVEWLFHHKRWKAAKIKAEKPTWRDRAAEAIDEELEAGMTDEEVREKYKENNE